jgi:hypothetical protein
MADTSIVAEAEFRAAMQGLVHELYFKRTHFPGLDRHISRATHDAEHGRCVDPDWDVFTAADDPFTMLLAGAAESVRPTPNIMAHDVLLDRWQRAESTINARLRAILAILTPVERAAVLRAMSPALLDLPALDLAFGGNPLGGKRADARFGQPDLVLKTATVLVSGEMKVRGGPARAKYNADQHFKYLRLASEFCISAPPPARCYHLVIAPLGGSRIISRPDSWLRSPVMDGVLLEIDASGMLATLSNQKRKRLEALGGLGWLERMLDTTTTVPMDLPRMLRTIQTSSYAAGPRRSVLERQIDLALRYCKSPGPTKRAREHP